MSEIQGPNRADHYSYSQLREYELQLIDDIERRILDHKNTLAELLRVIVNQTRRVLKARYVDILFDYPDGLRMEISSDEDEIGRLIPKDRSIAGLVLSNHRPVMVNNIQKDPQLREIYFPRVESIGIGPWKQSPQLSVLAAELTLDGQAIGVINVEARPDSRFNDSHLNFVNAVARQISLAITHAALFDEDNFRSATDKLLVEAVSGNSDMIMREVLDHILSALNSLTFVKPEAAEILFADPQDEQSLVIAYSTNVADIGVRVGIDSSICGEAFRRGKTVLLQQASERSYYRPIDEGMLGEMAVPIIFGDNKFPIGVLNLESSRENAFSNVGQVLAERFTKRVANAIAMTKMRADMDNELQDQLMILAADQVLNAIHRINNHVASIPAMVRDLLEDLDAPSPLHPNDLAYRLKLIGDNAGRALEIPDELQKRIGMPQESVDVNAQVEAGVAAVRIPKHAELVMDLAPGLPNIPCTALDLVVENLLLNAVKAINDRPGSLRVTSTLDERLPREPFIVITVQDNGVGMSEDELGRLFEPRRSGHQSGGLGFGMKWVRSWVRRAQGLIQVESHPGSGTTVRIRFQIDPQMIDRMSQGGDPT